MGYFMVSHSNVFRNCCVHYSNALYHAETEAFTLASGAL